MRLNNCDWDGLWSFMEMKLPIFLWKRAFKIYGIFQCLQINKWCQKVNIPWRLTAKKKSLEFFWIVQLMEWMYNTGAEWNKHGPRHKICRDQKQKQKHFSQIGLPAIGHHWSPHSDHTGEALSKQMSGSHSWAVLLEVPLVSGWVMGPPVTSAPSSVQHSAFCDAINNGSRLSKDARVRV